MRRCNLPSVMAMVRVFNPGLWAEHSKEGEVPGKPQPRKKKTLTREQIAKRQDKAVQFLRDVADDPDLADEIDDLSVEEYAQRKGFEVTSNPSKRRKGTPMKAEQVKDWINEAAKAGASEALRHNRRANQSVKSAPGQAAPPTVATRAKLDKEKILDRVDDATAALADGDEDEALDILNGVLEECDDD